MAHSLFASIAIFTLFLQKANFYWSPQQAPFRVSYSETSARDWRVERVRSRCLFLSHRLTVVRSSPESQLPTSLNSSDLSILWPLRPGGWPQSTSTTLRWFPLYLTILLQILVLSQGISKFSPFQCLSAFLSGPWLIVMSSRSGPRPKSIRMTFCHWVAHIWREQGGHLTKELIKYWQF